MSTHSLFVISSLEEGLDQALAELRLKLGQTPTRGRFAVAFFGRNYSANVLAQGLQDLLRGVPWIGMSVPALMLGSDLSEHGIGLALFCDKNLHVGVSGLVSKELSNWGAGQTAMRQALESLPNQQVDLTLFVLTNPLYGSATDTLLGAIHEAGSGPTWVGGSTGPTGCLIANGQLLDQPLVVAALTKPSVTALAQGWTPLNSTALVTRSSPGRIDELNYRPALSIYAGLAEKEGFRFETQYFTEFAASHPLAIPLNSGQYLVRNLSGFDAQGALLCGTNIPENCLIQLMAGSPENLMNATQTAAKTIEAANELSGVLAFIGNGRRPALSTQGSNELSLLTKTFEQTPLLGCVSFGEICRFGGGVPHYHNQTLALLGILK